MPKFRNTVKFVFGVFEARDADDAIAKCDEAIGAVIVDHPNGKQKVASEHDLDELYDDDEGAQES